MRDDGFIMLQRKFFSHDFWGEKRKFSRAEAFVDLIRSANFAPKRVLVGNAYIELERGQQIASLRFLGQRWGWSTFKVKSFLKLLFEEKMAYTKTKHQQIQLFFRSNTLYRIFYIVLQCKKVTFRLTIQ